MSRAEPLRGTITVPGDKSISHRAALVGALSREGIEVDHFSNGADCASTLDCLRRLGVAVEREGDRVRVRRNGPLAEGGLLDAGNSGTTARLLCGLLSGIPGVFSVITGDASLRRRPMSRVVDPLRTLGARIDGCDGGTKLPLSVRGTRLTGGLYTLPMASAQVKSALLLAGLSAQGSVTVVEPRRSRDHTEIMLDYLGVPLKREGEAVAVFPCDDLPGGRWTLPGDFSSAAFWIVAAALLAESDLSIEGVNLNPTRTGLLAVLERMGLDCDVLPGTPSGGEPTGTVTVRSSSLKATAVDGTEIPLLVDELPLLAVAATQARGVTEVRGAAELRVKESDRIAAMAEGLSALGAAVEERPDGWVIEGGHPLKGGAVSSRGDHRVAMALAVAGLVAEGEVLIDDVDCVAISYPGFLDELRRRTGR